MKCIQGGCGEGSYFDDSTGTCVCMLLSFFFVYISSRTHLPAILLDVFNLDFGIKETKPLLCSDLFCVKCNACHKK